MPNIACVCIIVNVFVVSVTMRWQPDVASATRPLYLAIARAVAIDVASGRLKPGDRLPPQRALAGTLGVALGTVTRAYAEAERRGLVTGHGRRGTVVTAGAARKPSGLSALVETGALIDLSANHPAASLDPDLPSALRALARRADTAALLGYPPSEGLPQHREVMAGWLEEQGVPASADAIVMTAGAQHAIAVALGVLARAGEEVACEALTFPGVRAAADVLGIKLRPVRMDAIGLVPEAFEDVCRTRSVRALYTIPTLHNPTSLSLDGERKRAIVRIAEKHGVTILEDEIHRPLARSPAPPFAALVADQSLLISSVSKTVAGGLRVGCIVAPARLKDTLVQAVQSSLIAAPSLNAEILRGWIEDGTVQRTIAARRKETAARQRLARRILGPVIVHELESTYVWLGLPEHWPCETFVREARARGVAVASAELFAVGPGRAPNAVRLALCAPASRQHLERGLGLLRDLLDGRPSRPAATL